MWQCASHRPGRSDTSPRSRTVYFDPMSDGSCDAGVTAVMRPSSTRTAWSGSHPETSALATRVAIKTVFVGTVTPVGRIAPAAAAMILRACKGPRVRLLPRPARDYRGTIFDACDNAVANGIVLSCR